MADSGPSPTRRRSDTDDPHRSRARALRIVFQADQRKLDAPGLLDDIEHHGDRYGLLDDDVGGTGELTSPRDARIAPPIDGFTRHLVTGVTDRQLQIDEMLAAHARGWQIRRMPAVDRTILRLAAFELLDGQTPAAVVINEAVEFAKQWSTDDSPRYVNGVLEAIRRHLDQPTSGSEAAQST